MSRRVKDGGRWRVSEGKRKGKERRFGQNKKGREGGRRRIRIEGGREL